MLALLRLQSDEITGWILAIDQDDLIRQINKADIPDSQGIIEAIGKLPQVISYGKHTLQPGLFLLSTGLLK